MAGSNIEEAFQSVFNVQIKVFFLSNVPFTRSNSGTLKI